MVSNIELEYKTLEETNGWRDIFQVNHFNNYQKKYEFYQILKLI